MAYQRRIFRNVLQSLWNLADTIEIASNADTGREWIGNKLLATAGPNVLLLSSYAGNMFDMVSDSVYIGFTRGCDETR
jgi:hypothetical protein